MSSDTHNKSKEVFETISKDRNRTNILKKYEQQALVYLVQRIPPSINSNMLTFIGFLGSLITMLSFVLASYLDRSYLLLGVLGFGINWFGDSLDGRVAYYRHTPRKWYGFSLDITTDWITTILIGAGFIFYIDGWGKWLGFIFVVMYGWAMVTDLLKYKITDKYVIDSGLLGPTEARVLISSVLVAEVVFEGSIFYCALLLCAILFIVNILGSKELLRLADDLDKAEKLKKQEEKNA